MAVGHQDHGRIAMAVPAMLAGAVHIPMEKLPARPPEDRPRDRTEGAKAACEGRGHLEGGEVARDRDWHGPSHLKRAWLKASTAILPLSPSFLCVAPGRGDFSVSNIHPGLIPGNLVYNDLRQ